MKKNPTVSEKRISRIDVFLNSFKVVDIQFKNVVRFIKIEDLEDLNRYIQAYQSRTIGGTFRRLLHCEDIEAFVSDNATNINKTLDHHAAALYMSGNDNLPVTIHRMLMQKGVAMLKCLQEGHVLLVNQAGGYMFLKEDMNIIEESFEDNFGKIFE